VRSGVRRDGAVSALACVDREADVQHHRDRGRGALGECLCDHGGRLAVPAAEASRVGAGGEEQRHHVSVADRRRERLFADLCDVRDALEQYPHAPASGEPCEVQIVIMHRSPANTPKLAGVSTSPHGELRSPWEIRRRSR
jgi:hypothetical protein